MDVNIATYRSRIGNFYTSGIFNFLPGTIEQTDRTKSRPSHKIRIFILCLVLLTSTVSKPTNPIKLEPHKPFPKFNSVNSWSSGTKPLYSIRLGGQFLAKLCPVLHLCCLDVPSVLAASVHGVQAGTLDKGCIISAHPLQYTGLSDSNFYARYTYGNRANRGVKLTHWNAGNAYLENKVNDIEKLVADHHPHLLGISEANLHKHHGLDHCKIPDYELITSKTMDNVNLQVSSVVLYKHSSLVGKIREDLMSDSFSSIWLEVGFPGKTRFLVCNIYRDWQFLGQADHSSLDISEQLARWIIFLEQWEKALDSGKECIVMGDFNLDFLTFNNEEYTPSARRLKPLVNELFSRIVPQGVKQCVVGSTRQGRSGQCDSGLDHLWTNNPTKMSQIYTKYNGSDHKVIMGVRFAKMVKTNVRYVRKRSFKNFEESVFLQKIRSLSWWDLYQATDVNKAVDIFTKKVSHVLDQVAPVKTFQTSSKYCPWLTQETKVLIKEINKVQENLSKNKNHENFKKFRKLRNGVTKALRNDKLAWQRQKLETCSMDSGKLWKNVLGWLNWTSSGSPSKLYHEGQVVTSPARLANIMNNFFTGKVDKIRKNLPPASDDPLRTLKHVMKDNNCKFKLAVVYPDTIKRIIQDLKNSKSCGMDDIDTYTIKLMGDDIVPAVTHIVNLSLKQAIFPSLYKMAKIIPLLKKDDPLEPKNYRPVAILCILSKIIERAIFIQIVDFMNRNNLFHPNHHGFRAHHSTSTAMIQMFDSWVQAVDKGELAGVCMLDML